MSPTCWVLVMLMVLSALLQFHSCLNQEFPDYGELEPDSRSLKKKKKKLQCLLHLHSQQRSYGEERTLGLLGALAQFEDQQEEEDHHEDPCEDAFHGLFSGGQGSQGGNRNRDRNAPFYPQSYARQLSRLLRPVNRALRPIYRLF
ncbi:uncharacterized protein LOC134528137 [Bacillus rossius redtenbacheri]|uniref:uncharacterized protein LOC134528137 n=1 Tax=Bacillus rossius redtenbacheri TaxID=93214 RepID=UPI002FDCEF1C